VPTDALALRAHRARATLRHGLDWSGRKQAGRFARLRDEYYRAFWQTAARETGAECEEAAGGLLKICRANSWTFVSRHEVMADSRLALRIAGDKPLVLRLLEADRYPVPRHMSFDLTTLGQARGFQHRIAGNLVVKPANGSAGRGVTTGVDTWQRLRQAAGAAAAFCERLVAEEQVPGDSYRLLYLDGRLVDAVERGCPAVTGDGMRTIRQLMAAETEARLEHRPMRALSPLTVDLDCQFTLESLGLTTSYVPAAGERIVVKSVANQNSALEQRSVLDRVHPAIARMGARLVSQLGLEFVGLDLMATDIGAPLEEGGGALIEINTTPGLHHHALVAGDAVPVGALVLERMFARHARRVSVEVNGRAETAEAAPTHRPAEAATTVKADDLEALTLSIVRASGATGPQAERFAKILVWNDRIGRATHGVWRLEAYCRRFELGLIRCPCAPIFNQTAAAAGTLDGDEGFGLYVGHVAMQRAIGLATKAGAGVVAVSNSNHFASAAYYVELAARRGMIGIALSNSTPRVAAFGGAKPVFGTNPIAFGAPRRDGRSVLVDIATSAISGAHLINCVEKGGVLEAGMAIDADGNPTIDPRRASDGALLPFGGAKGYGVALMVEILSGVLSGAAFSHDVRSMFKDFRSSGRNGHLFVAIDIARFMPLDTYHNRLDTLLGIVTHSGKDGQSPVLVPGEGRWDAYDRTTRDGISLDRRAVRSLETLADRHGIPVPWKRGATVSGEASPLAGPLASPPDSGFREPPALQAS
jgi:LDH2 family malate/lactate/ureidoglycolate dehydrogenase/D-alanine-D-alanine ligase-like ATP-grasp enzyme